MQRLLLGLAAVAALAACTDSTPTGTRARGPDLRTRSTISIADAQDELDIEIRAIIACWPKGIENEMTGKWEGILKKYNEGQTNPKKLREAFKKLAEASKHALKHAPKFEEPTCEGMSHEEAATKLVEDMVLYLTGGDPEGDNVSGVLTPDDELTLKTPQGWAGVHFDDESTKEDRIIVITQNPKEDYGICDGPLLTELCQYPLFYDIQSFPDDPLLKVATVAICHPPEGDPRGPANGFIHDNLRIAHTKPDKEADYTPNGSIRETPASDENIEILPLVAQTLVTALDCADAFYPPLSEESAGGAGLLERGLHLASTFVARVGKFLAPRSAYAIDQGAGGLFLDFSPFNYVDICYGDTPEASCEAPTGPTGFTGSID